MSDLFAGLDVDASLLEEALRHADEHSSEPAPDRAPESTDSAPATGVLWIPEAEDLSSHTGAFRGGGLMEGGPPRVVWHTTEAPSGGGYFDAMDRVLTSKTAWSTLLYDPLTDRLGQYFPLNRSARALADPAGGVRTNRAGIVCIQIEVVAYASKPFTAYWKPGKNYAAMMRAIRSWGVPDLFTQPQQPYPGPATDRSVTTWLNKAGHRSHQNVPENDHGDAGDIDEQAILTAGSTPPPPPADWFDMATKQDLIDALLSPEVRWAQIIESGGQPTTPIFMATTEGEGGRVYMLIPGKPKHWVTPNEWDLVCRLFPQAAKIVDPKRPWNGRFLEEEVDRVWAMLQPTTTRAAEAQGVTVADILASREADESQQ